MGNDIEALGDPGAQELLASPQPIRLAYAGRDGFPRVVPVGFLWKADRIYVCTAITAPKVAALRERPQVAGVIDQGISSSDAKQLLVRGTAEIEIVDGVAPEYFEAAAKGEGGKDLKISRSRSEPFSTSRRESRSLRNGRGSMTSGQGRCRPSYASWRDRGAEIG
jgi:hypothetical protein